MSIRRSLIAALAASGLFLGTVVPSAAQAYGLDITEGICSITFSEWDNRQVQEGLDAVLLDSYAALDRDIPSAEIADISAITVHVFNNWGKRDFTTAWDFRGSPVSGVAHRLNNAARKAGFNNNEVFEIVRYQYLMSLDVVTEVATMRQSHHRPDGEPLLITIARATGMEAHLRAIDLAPRGNFSTRGQRNIDVLADGGYKVLQKAYEPIIRCAGGPGAVGGGMLSSSSSS